MAEGFGGVGDDVRHVRADDQNSYVKPEVREPLMILPSMWYPTHEHRTGTMVRVLRSVRNEADLKIMVEYDEVDGKVWVRDINEFFDGRFRQLT